MARTFSTFVVVKDEPPSKRRLDIDEHDVCAAVYEDGATYDTVEGAKAAARDFSEEEQENYAVFKLTAEEVE